MMGWACVHLPARVCVYVHVHNCKCLSFARGCTYPISSRGTFNSLMNDVMLWAML